MPEIKIEAEPGSERENEPRSEAASPDIPDEFVIKTPAFPMTSDELHEAINSRISNVNTRSRSFGKPPTSALNKMRRNMATENASDEQLDDEFLEGLRDDIAEWETNEEVTESGKISPEADITAEVGTLDDAVAPPKADVPVDDVTKHMPQ
ncbi:hypothetical protein FLAG1_10049 [Fusarium langsethiae]|uniref:Uncharacterized protein n=1 Tax=Fusarium langsethiae TaxID=179993 RepID=A0A0M9EPV4_FUSLA|nr:hypothetical protein FLAG1_10049 [Fusarium langsethiae]GKU14039.1 unnamed protein product [Fusarium langsethiae]